MTMRTSETIALIMFRSVEVISKNSVRRHQLTPTQDYLLVWIGAMWRFSFYFWALKLWKALQGRELKRMRENTEIHNTSRDD
mgnify:CR=1 FL=1